MFSKFCSQYFQMSERSKRSQSPGMLYENFPINSCEQNDLKKKTIIECLRVRWLVMSFLEIYLCTIFVIILLIHNSVGMINEKNSISYRGENRGIIVF